MDFGRFSAFFAAVGTGDDVILVGDPETGLVSSIRWVFMEKMAKMKSESLVKNVKKPVFVDRVGTAMPA